LQKEISNSGQAFWVVLASLSSFGLSLISAAIFSRYFDKSDYGTYRQILFVYNTLLIIFTAGLPHVFSYFLPRYSLEQGKDIVWKISRGLFLSGLIFSIFLFFFSTLIGELLKNPELSKGLKYFSPVPMLLLPTLGIEGIFSTYRKTFFIALYNVLTRTLMLFFIILPVILFEGTYIHAILGWVLASFISFIIALYFKSLPFKNVKAIKADLTYESIFSYSIPLVVASIAGIAIKSADQFYISRFFGPEVFAEFSNGFMELPLVGMITGAASTVLLPIFSKLIHNKAEIINITELWKNTLLKSATLIYPMVIFFIYNSENVVIILYSSTYKNSAIYFNIAMFLNFFNIIIFSPLLFAMGKTKFYSNLHLFIAFLAWTGEYIIVTQFKSPIAIAIYSVILGISKIIICFKYVSFILNVNILDLIPVRNLSILLIHSIFVGGFIKISVSQLVPQSTNFVSLVINLLGFLIMIIITANFFRIDYFLALRPLLKFKSSLIYK